MSTIVSKRQSPVGNNLTGWRRFVRSFLDWWLWDWR